MPTILLVGGLRFFFYANDHEPIHVHVQRGNKGPKAKIQIDPHVSIVSVQGFSKGDMRRILKFCEENKETFIESWEDFFA